MRGHRTLRILEKNDGFETYLVGAQKILTRGLDGTGK